MAHRIPRAVTGAALLLVAAGCRTDQVGLPFGPQPGDRQQYRYEVAIEIDESLDGGEPRRTELRSEITADQEITAVTDDGARARVALSSGDAASRTVDVRIDASGLLRGVDLIAGQAVSTFGLDELSVLLASGSIPAGPLAPGASWSLDDGDGVTGEGRLTRLGVVDGRRRAVIDTDLQQDLDETVSTGRTTADLEGRLRARTTTARSLDDGLTEEATTRATGEVTATIRPPVGIDARPAVLAISYRIRIDVARLA